MSKISQYVDLINQTVNQRFDYEKEEVVLGIGNILKDLFRRVYGDYSVDWSDCSEDDGFALVPSIIEGNNGKKYLALVELNVEDSGEHYDTIFFTSKGTIYQKDLKDKGFTDIVPYTYKTLVDVVGDIHAESI